MAQPKAQREPVTSETRDLSGTSVGRFRVGARLGAGGMGEVYRAEDTKLKRTVALKRISPRLSWDQHSRQRFLREAECASRLNEPHIAGIYDVFEEGGETFLIMEYVEGQTLRERMAQPLSISEFLSIAQQCAAAVAAAHRGRVIHRDLKPENIMLTSGDQVKILDFGVAKVLLQQDETATTNPSGVQSEFFAGTPTYMAPEVLLGKEADGRADIFSLGIIFYEALTGRHPFRSESFLATSQKILGEAARPLREYNPRVPEELERIVGKMLAKEREERYATADDLLVDLRSLQKEKSEPFTRPAARPVWARRLLIGGVAGIAVLALTVLFALLPAARQRVRGWLGIHRVAPQNLVAVLPAEAGPYDPQTAPFRNGLTEAISAQLARLPLEPTLQVVSASEIRAKGVRTVEAARRELGATQVLMCDLKLSGDQLRVTVSLVDARNHEVLRTEGFNVPAANPFSVQERVMDAAAGIMALEIPSRRGAPTKARETQVANAYVEYWRGRGYLQDYDKVENIESALKAFDAALQQDPNYALAYAGRAEAYWMLYESSKDPKWIESSRQDCKQVLKLDSALPAGHLCLGRLYKGTGGYREAVQEFERAVEAEPANADAFRELAEAYDSLGNPDLAEATYRRAIELRPHYWAGYNWLGAFYYGRAQYAKAAEMFEQVTALAPDNPRGLSNLGVCYVEQGRYRDAIAVLERSIAVRPAASPYTNLGNAYFYLHRYEDATRAYEQATRFDQPDAVRWRNLADGYYWTPGARPQAAAAYQRAIAIATTKLQVNPNDASLLGTLAVCHAMLGEKARALYYLRKGLELAPNNAEMLFKAALVHLHSGDGPQCITWLERARSAGISPARIRDTPDFEPLRSEPRFQELFRAK
jgi:tetratricopeptide (TPR) repeat protein/TolB-like protein